MTSTCLIKCRKAFGVIGPILWRWFQAQKTTCIFRGRRSTLDVSMFILRGSGSTLDVSCYLSCANRDVRAASSCDNVLIAWQAWDVTRMSFCVAGAVWDTFVIAIAAFRIGMAARCDVAFVFRAILRGRRSTW